MPHININAARLVSEVCYIYGYNPAYVLGMPAVQFFSLLKYGKEIELEHMLDMIDIGALAIGSYDYYKDLRSSVSNRLRIARGIKEEKTPVFDTLEAKPILFNMIGACRG